MAELVWQAGQTILFCGDSITDCGRRDAQAPLGGGYVRQVVDLVRGRYPDRPLQFINTGVSGDCVDDLQARWQRDVMDHQPDWVAVMIGINDLHRTLGDIKHLPPAEFEPRYRDILDRTVAAGARLLLIDPFYLSLEHGRMNHEGEVLHRLDGYLEVVERLAGDYHALHCRTQARWLPILREHPPEVWCPEPVHPNVHGHLVIAQMVLETVGF